MLTCCRSTSAVPLEGGARRVIGALASRALDDPKTLRALMGLPAVQRAIGGDLELALQGSFLPAPALSAFGDLEEHDAVPGAVLAADGAIELNAGRSLIELNVTNTGDRPVQVGSHYHFIETNKARDVPRW